MIDLASLSSYSNRVHRGNCSAATATSNEATFDMPSAKRR
jgi:hypothetical protein